MEPTNDPEERLLGTQREKGMEYKLPISTYKGRLHKPESQKSSVKGGVLPRPLSANLFPVEFLGKLRLICGGGYPPFRYFFLFKIGIKTVFFVQKMQFFRIPSAIVRGVPHFPLICFRYFLETILSAIGWGWGYPHCGRIP